jgi:hypothetical protein
VHWIELLYVVRIGDRNDNNHSAIGVNRISREYDNGTETGLFASFGRIETRFKNVASDGLWQGSRVLLWPVCCWVRILF